MTSMRVVAASLVGGLVIASLNGEKLQGQHRDEATFEAIRDAAAVYCRDLGYVTMRFDRLGNPRVALRSGYEFGTGEWVRLQVLWSEEGQEALGLVEQQEAAMKKLAAAFQVAVRKLPTSVDTKDESGRRRTASELERLEAEVRRRHVAVQTSYWQEARRVLRPHQRRRLDQLVVRYFIRQYGWLHALTHGPISRSLDISRPVRSRIVERARALHQEIEAEALKEEKRVRDKLLGVLPQEKRRKIIALLEPPLRNRRSAIDWLIWNLEDFAEAFGDLDGKNPARETREGGQATKVGAGPQTGEKASDKAASPKDPFPARGLDLAIADPGRSDVRIALVPIARRQVTVLEARASPMTWDFLTLMLLSAPVQEELELVDFQKRTIHEKYGEAVELIRKNFAKFSREFDASLAIEMVAEQQEPARRAMLDVLLPHQKRHLARIILLRQIRLNGLPQTLVRGHIRNMDPLTSAEIDALQERAARAAGLLRQKRIDWEKRVESELTAQLDAEQRVLLKRLIGPPLSGDGAWLSLTLGQLRDGHRSRSSLGHVWAYRGDS